MIQEYYTTNVQHMQHKNAKKLTKKYRISAVCRHFFNLQVLKTRAGRFFENTP